MPFVGRRGDLALLGAELDQVRAGHPRVVLIEGTAGIGKTALVKRFLAQSSDAQMLGASGEQSEVLLAYGALDQLLRAAAVTGAPAEPRRVPFEDHLTVGAQFLDLLGSLQEQGLVIVRIDDVQWVDDPSLKALVFALRRLRMDRVLALLVVRSEEVHRLPEGLSRLIRDVGVTLRMQGLTAGDLGELADVMGVWPFSEEAALRLHEHTEGNPLHAHALLDELPVSAWRHPELSLPAPRSFGLLVLGRRAQCSEKSQRMIDAAAVLGMHCALDSAARLADVDDPRGALDEANGAGLLQPMEPIGAGRITFPHPLIQAAIYHALDTATRADLHARAAELVGDDAASLRHRVAAAASADSKLANELADFARAEAGRGAWASAGAHLISASRLSPTRPERERLLLEAVNSMLFGGNLSEAAAYSEEIARLVPSSRRDSVLGQLALQRGLPIEAEQLLQSAWQQCDPAADPELGASIALQNAVHMLAQIRGSEGAEWARRALQLSNRPDSPIAFRGLGLLSLTLAYAGQPAEAGAVLDTLKLTGEVGPNDWALVIRGLLSMVEDDLPNALADLRLAAKTALQRGLLQGAASALGWLATAEYYSGAWDDALRHAERAVLVNTESERQHRAFVASAVVAVPAARGDWSLADEHALMVARQFPGYESSIASAAMAGAELATARLNHQGVLDALQPVLSFTHRQGIDEPGFWPWQDLYADALVSQGRVAEADAFLRPHESLAAARFRRSMMARLARVRGRIEAAEGRSEEAETAFRKSLDCVELLAMPFEEARIQLAYGGFLRRLGRRRDAASQLLAAQRSLIDLGAEPYLERCERELSASGLRPRKRRDEDRTRLTPQELTVARLVASGLSNREVAAELFLSTKTIEFHLSRIFDKLDITSRRQIAKHPRIASAIKDVATPGA